METVSYNLLGSETLINQALIQWAENKYKVKSPRIIYSRHFPLPGADSAYCSGEGETPSHEPVIMIWKGAQNPEFLYLHELQHHIRRELEKRESPDLKERWADYLAKCDLVEYHFREQLADLKPLVSVLG